MDTKSFEVLIHSQYAFDVCRNEVNLYEDCRQTDTPSSRDPVHCREFSRNVLQCYKEAEKMDPLCLTPFNDARECLFKGDGNLYNCKEWVNLYVHCQKDPADYSSFLAASSKRQLKPKAFDFTLFRGYFDKYL